MQNGESSFNVSAASSRPSSRSSLDSRGSTNLPDNTTNWEDFEHLLNAHCQRVLQEIDKRFKVLTDHLWADIDQHCAQPDLIHRTFTDNFYQIDDYLDHEFGQTKQELDRALGMERRRPSGTYLQPSSAVPSSAYPSGTTASGFPSGTTPSGYPSGTTASGFPGTTASGFPSETTFSPSSGYPSATSGTTAPSSFVDPTSTSSTPFPTQRRSSASLGPPVSSTLSPSTTNMDYLTPRSSLSRLPTGTVSQARTSWTEPSTALAGGDRGSPTPRQALGRSIQAPGGNMAAGYGDQGMDPWKGASGPPCAYPPCPGPCVYPCCPVPCQPVCCERPPAVTESRESWQRYKSTPSLFAWGVLVGICAALMFLYLGSSLPACIRQYIPFLRQDIYPEYTYRRKPYDAFWTSCGTSFLEWWMYTRNLFFN